MTRDSVSKPSRRLWTAGYLVVASSLSRFLDLKVTVVDAGGGDRMARGGPLLVASNHLDFYDGGHVRRAVPRRHQASVCAVADAEFLRHWRRPSSRSDVRRQFLRLMFDRGFRPIWTRDPNNPATVVEQIVEALHNDEIVIIFPEGTPSEAELHPFHTGVAVAAMQTGVDIIPVHLLGSQSFKSDGRIGMRRHKRVTVRIGPVASPQPAESAADLAARLREVIPKI